MNVDKLNSLLIHDFGSLRVGVDDLPIVFSLTDIFKQPNDLNDFAELKNFLVEGKIIHEIQVKIKAEGETKDSE